MMPSPRLRPYGLLVALTLVLTACGGAADDGTQPVVSSSAPSPAPGSPGPDSPPASTTPAPSEGVTGGADEGPTAALQAILDEGYDLSDEWVVESVVRDLDSATGGLAIGPDGAFYQADFGYPGHPGSTIRRIEPDGAVSDFASDERFESLTMTTFGADGRLYQSSYGSDTVFVVDEDGTAEVVATDISGPTGIVALEDGTLYVQAYDASRIHQVDPDGTVAEFARHNGFRGPNGLTMAPDGTMYSSNHRDGGLFAVDADGTVTELHQFPHETSHVVWADDSLFVTSRGGHVVYRYDLATDAVEVIAGNGEPGDADGRGGAASFGRPNAIIVGDDGELYVNHGTGDANNPLHIRRISHQP